jgi:hypothetical protein
MQNPISLEIDFRLNRLSIRLDRLGKHFEQLASEVRSGEEIGLSLKTLQECKLFIEWTGIDLEVDRAYELLQMQRQLVQWQRNWSVLWQSVEERSQVDRQLQVWVQQIKEMSGVFA